MGYHSHGYDLFCYFYLVSRLTLEAILAGWMKEATILGNRP